MKLSMETYALRERFGDKKATALIKDAGFDAVDYSYCRFSKSTDGSVNLGEQVLGDGYIEYAKELRAYMDSIGIKCNQVHVPFASEYGEKFCGSELDWKEIISALKAVEYDGELTLEIFKYIAHFPNELIPDALCFANNVGKYLISELERI